MKRTDKASDLYEVSISYIQHLLQIGARWGISEEELLRGSGLEHDVLGQVDARITTRQAGKLTQHLMHLSGREDVGMEYGLLVRPTTHGFLGYAVMSCATLAEAMQVLYKYQTGYVSDFTRTVQLQGGEVVITVEGRYEFGSMRRIFFEAFLVAVCQHIAFLIGQELSGLKVHVDWPRPDYFEAYEGRMPYWEFNQAHNQIRFPRSYLSLPLVLADPHAVKQALTLVEREAAARTLLVVPDILSRVRSALQPVGEGYPGLPEVAIQLCLSERTLKRRLSDVGSSFQALLDEARRRRSVELIQGGKHSLQEIAQILGYTDPAAFTRAFKRWTGMRPSDYLKQSAGK